MLRGVGGGGGVTVGKKRGVKVGIGVKGVGGEEKVGL